MKIINYFRIVFIIIFLSLGVVWGFSKKSIETNIIQAILPENSQENQLLNLTKKYSNNINIIFEADSEEDAETLKTDFYNKVDKDIFNKQELNFDKIFNNYEKSKDYLLSINDRKLLLNRDYSLLEKNAKNQIYNPFGIILTDFETDPYLLFSNFLLSLQEKNSSQSRNFYNNKYYSVLSIVPHPNFKTDDISYLIKLKSEFEKDNNKIYLTGVPIHSYYTSKNSEREINIICIITLLFIFGLCFLYFRSLKILIPITVSILLAILAGYMVTSIIFKEVHILSFVFATTLIGICIDYSLHYFLEQDVKNIIKPLTSGLITTVSAFLILLFSDMVLLKQMAVFTSVGLIFVYFFVILFYPLIKFNINFNRTNFIDKLNLLQDKKCKMIILPIVVIVICLGFFKLNFNDDIRSFYTPKGELLKSEQILKMLKNEESVSFLLISNTDFQTLLEQNEAVGDELSAKNIDFVSISDFLPSIKRQKENFKLKRELYKNHLSDFNGILNGEQLTKLQNQKDEAKYITYNPDLNFLDKFLIDENQNTSIIMLYNVKTNPVNHNNVKFINITEGISKIIHEGRNKCRTLFLPIILILYIILTALYGFKKGCLIILPSLIGSLFSFSISVLINTQVSIFNILAIFLIAGFSLDYSIFRSNGVKNSDNAVFVSCITSVFSFFLLSMTSFKLISSFGLMISIGLLTSYILSFLLISKE